MSVLFERVSSGATRNRPLDRLSVPRADLLSLVSGADPATYEPLGRSTLIPHCKQCGTIEDVAYALPERPLGDIALETGFTVESGNVTYAARCGADQTS